MMLVPSISQIAAWPSMFCQRMSEKPSPLKSEGTAALTVVTPPLWVTRPWITPVLVKPPLNSMLPQSTLSVAAVDKIRRDVADAAPARLLEQAVVDEGGGRASRKCLCWRRCHTCHCWPPWPTPGASRRQYSPQGPTGMRCRTKSSDSAPEIVPEKLASPGRFIVCAAPLLVTVPAPCRLSIEA